MLKNYAVYVLDTYGNHKLLWFSDRQDMVAEYSKFVHLIAQDKGIAQVFSFELCAGETREAWVKALGG